MIKPVILPDLPLSIVHEYAEVCLKRRPFVLEMADRILHSYHDRIEARRCRAAMHFKLCPVCEELSIIEAPECHTCTWHGKFNHDPFEIEEQFEKMIEKCPSLINAVPKSSLNRGMSLKIRFRKFVRGILNHSKPR